MPDGPNTILTHSHSGTLIKVLKYLLNQGLTITVVQTESLPGGEGSLQAEELKQLPLRITLINDSQINEYITGVNFCLLGADQYDKAFFVNKTGSKVIVDIAFRHNVPVYVLGDTRKRVDRVPPMPGKLFERVAFRENVKLINEDYPAHPL
jgi:translation initiation factor 2B subunit (eIF-2B alpha/beta/delta family)